MFKRIISFLLVVAMIIFVFPLSVFADDTSSDYKSRILNYWDSLMYAFCHDADALGKAIAGHYNLDSTDSLISCMVSRTASFLDPDVICEFSDDHYHHGNSLVSDTVYFSDSYGCYAKVLCDNCGLSFDYYSADLEYLYDDYVSTLDSTKFGSNYVSYNGIELAKNKFTDDATRSYDIEMESGTFYIDDTEITEIVLDYGDDVVTIGYFDSSGSGVQVDEYAYVMVASSECNLYGHSYSTEITKDTGCIGPGERTYTCSVCGDQYVEEITMLEHSYTAAVTKEPTCTSTGTRMYTCSGCGGQYTEEIPMSEHSYVWSVLKEPTCTDSGLYIYTCSGCGGQHTESVEALGHDWISTDSADDTYMLPEGTSCPDCSGTDFAAELDEINGVYSCTCNSCGSSWTTGAEITSGYTLYTCFRCGAMKTVADSDGDGLFASIGNFFADGINWCTEKLSQLADNLTSMVDSFNDYMDSLSEGGEFPGFISAVIGLLPDDLTNVIWFGIVAAVIVFVLCKWFK